MNDSGKLSLSLTILISSIILGGFYYATEVNKQESIERQEAMRIEERRRLEEKEDNIKVAEAQIRSDCSEIAADSAADMYKSFCLQYPSACPGYQEGTYMRTVYEASYKTCLQRSGLE